MEVVGSAVGIASLGIQVCQSLLSYYDEWKDYHSDIRDTSSCIEDLGKTFAKLKVLLQDPGRNDEESRAATIRLQSCEDDLVRLQEKLVKLREHDRPNGLRQKTWAELQRAFYPLRASNLIKIRQLVASLTGNLSLTLQTLQIAENKVSHNKLLGELQTQGRDAAIRSDAHGSRIADVLAKAEASLFKDICDWLSPPDPCHNHDAACKCHKPGTGSWLLTSERYKHWKPSSNPIFWLYGKAGCGKTVLCYTVIEDLRLWSQLTPDSQLAFFYFSFSDIHKQSYMSLLLSLVSQLCKGGPSCERLKQLYDHIYPSKPSTGQLEELLSLSIQHSGQIVLVLDALDESPDHYDSSRQEIMDWLERIAVLHRHKLKIFVTSRQISDIQESMTSLGADSMSVQPNMTNTDIRSYVISEISEDRTLRRLDASLQKKIEDSLAQKADGMFRWAFCQLEELKNLKSMRPKYVEQALNNLPSTLDATYDRMLLQIDEKYRDEALTALRWLAFELRPLSLSELSEACLINPDGDGFVDVANRGPLGDLLEILAGLVLVEANVKEQAQSPLDIESKSEGTVTLWPQHVHPSSTIRLAHFSVKEYLISSRILKSQSLYFALSEDRDQWILAQSCIVYILHYGQSQHRSYSKGDFNNFPLLFYAATLWPLHMSKCNPQKSGHEIRLLRSEKFMLNWFDIYDPDEQYAGPFKHCTFSGADTSLYYASGLEIKLAIQDLLKQKADVNAKEGFNGNALQAASARGHEGIVKLLLSEGAHVNAQGGYGVIMTMRSKPRQTGAMKGL